MSIFTALAQLDPQTGMYAIAGGAAVLAVLLASVVGVHQRDVTLGRARLTPEERLGSVWWAAAIGFYSLLLPGLFYGLTRTTPTTLPASTQIAPETSAWLALASPLTVIVVLAICNTFIWPQWLTRLGLKLRDLPRGLLAGLAAIVIVLPLMFLVIQATQIAWEQIGLEHPKAHALLRAMNEDPDTFVQWAIILSAVILAPIAEELLFRGFLQTAIQYTLNRRSSDTLTRWIAILLTSCVFTLFHPELWMAPPIFILSMCLGYLYERTGILWACMLLHAGFNAANVILFRLQNGH